MGAADSPNFSGLWSLEPTIRFLNHGSFGACPLEILHAQRRYRDQLEREPVRFFVRELEKLMDEARAELALFVGADPDGLVFVPNATSGVNAVLRSLQLKSGDELVTTNHAYNACRNVLDFVAGRSGARVVAAEVPFPIQSPEVVLERILGCVGKKTRLALIDHITSPTALIFPIARLVSELQSRGVDVLVDGAHAPGMVPLELRSIGAAYYTGNCHKWMCTPKGSAFLYVRDDRQEGFAPLVIGHGANSRRNDRSRFRLQFDMTATRDPSAYLCIPVAIRYLGSLLPGGWRELMQRNHSLAVAARAELCKALELPPPAPEEMLGSMSAVPLPSPESASYSPNQRTDPLQDELLFKFKIEVPVMWWPERPKRVLRVSAQLYNRIDEYQALAALFREGRLQALRR